jgi:autotransporter passenger strand-loop-strand repeat protein
VENGGFEGIAHGYSVSGLAVSSGATLVVSKNTGALDIDILDGGTIALAGGIVSKLTLAAKAKELVESGTTLSVSSGQTARNVTVADGGEFIFAGAP